MPSSDYTGVGGGLKLKGAKNAGVDKKRKKKKAPTSPKTDNHPTSEASRDEGLRKALQDEDTVESAKEKEQEDKATFNAPGSEPHTSGGVFAKTEAERRHEERRRKKVCQSRSFSQMESVLLTGDSA